MCQDDLDKLLTGGAIDLVIKSLLVTLGLMAGMGIIWTIILLAIG